MRNSTARFICLAAVTGTIAAMACGESAAATSTPSQSPSAQATESPVKPLKPLVALNPDQPITEGSVRAVVDGVFVQGVFLDDPKLYAECQYYHGGDPSFKACPLTARLEARLTSRTGHFPPRYGAGAFCRCLAVSADIAVSAALGRDEATAHVRLFGGSQTVDLLLVRSSGYLLVDDIQCGGKGSSSSIYIDPIPPC
jgi:hypothetical protein